MFETGQLFIADCLRWLTVHLGHPIFALAALTLAVQCVVKPARALANRFDTRASQRTLIYVMTNLVAPKLPTILKRVPPQYQPMMMPAMVMVANLTKQRPTTQQMLRMMCRALIAPFWNLFWGFVALFITLMTWRAVVTLGVPGPSGLSDWPSEYAMALIKGHWTEPLPIVALVVMLVTRAAIIDAKPAQWPWRAFSRPKGYLTMLAFLAIGLFIPAGVSICLAIIALITIAWNLVVMAYERARPAPEKAPATAPSEPVAASAPAVPQAALVSASAPGSADVPVPATPEA